MTCWGMIPILFGGDGLDRAPHIRKDPQALALLAGSDRARVALFKDELVRLTAVDTIAWASPAELPGLAPEVFLGLAEGVPLFAQDVSGLAGFAEGNWVALRSFGARLPAAEAGVLAYAQGLLGWNRRGGHCSLCGAPAQSAEGGHLRVCTSPSCAARHFPRTDPAIIVLVEDEARILLGRQPSWPSGMWSCLAGFVEPGETLEEAVMREVAEETGIIVAEIGYVASQPWPFPSSLMVGFTARAVGGKLRADGHEIEDARWFDRPALAVFDDANRQEGQKGLHLPRHGTIARSLIEAWIRREP